MLLCRKKDTGRLYAMKILKKSKIIREKKIKPILSERAVLEQLDHPFIVKLHWAFQSKEELFFVMDICTGGEIFFQRPDSGTDAVLYCQDVGASRGRFHQTGRS